MSDIENSKNWLVKIYSPYLLGKLVKYKESSSRVADIKLSKTVVQLVMSSVVSCSKLK